MKSGFASPWATIVVIGGSWAVGYNTQPEKPCDAAIASRRTAEAELADTRRRLEGCRVTIRRYQEELAWVDEQLAKGGAK